MVGHTGEAMETKRKAKQPVEENEGEAMETKRKAKEPVEENESAHWNLSGTELNARHSGRLTILHTFNLLMESFALPSMAAVDLCIRRRIFEQHLIYAIDKWINIF